MKQFNELFATLLAVAAANPDGFTFNLAHNEMQAHGLCVARKETQNSFNADGLKNALSFALANNVACVGGWYDSASGLTYFDATDIFNNRDEAEHAARENEQIAYFDIDTCEEVRI